jgi:hypothetical protein
MIYIKSNLDRLENSAANLPDASQLASDIRAAIMDIQNLRDHITNLEKTPVDLGAVINDAINGRIKAALTDSRIEATLTDSRLEALEQFKDDLNVEADDIDGLESFVDAIVETHISDSVDRDNETRDTIKDMINDGDIIVSIDVS